MLLRFRQDFYVFGDFGNDWVIKVTIHFENFNTHGFQI